MPTQLVVHANTPPARLVEALADIVGRPVGELAIERRTGHCRIALPVAIEAQRLDELRALAVCDINRLPTGFVPEATGLLISDMDSTLIGIECIDEIADYLGVKPEVAAITEAAMRGEIDFAESLTRRVALLAGLEATVLERVYEERLFLNPGAEALVAGLHERGIRMALVSGGFTFFTDRLVARLGIDHALANRLEIDASGRLTGRILGRIVDARGKADFLESLCRELDRPLEASVAIGDGANDLPMMARAGLSIAYHAKPAVRARADCALNLAGLDAVLDLIAP